MKNGSPVVLTLCDYYLPGYRGGGPIRTLEAIIEYLSDEFRFKVLTRNRDLGATEPYPNVTPGVWHGVAAAQVMYLRPRDLSALALRKLISATDYDLLYLNSCFSVPFGIKPLFLRRLGQLPPRSLLVAPRGEFAGGALALHSGRKRAYMRVAKALGLTRGVMWHASGPHEAQDIRRAFGQASRVFVAPDLAAARALATRRVAEKVPGRLRVLFLGRVSPMKNLDGALRLLDGVTGDIEFTIHGPIEDSGYWQRCQELLSKLPNTIKVHYGGEVDPDQVGHVIASHDLLLLPTLGENYGHVILEALANGCPVLISDRTRWRGLEAAGVGWDVALDRPERYRAILRDCVEMDAAGWRRLSESAAKYGAEALNDPVAHQQNRRLFRSFVQRRDANLAAKLTR